MKVTDLKIGDKIIFMPCGECCGKNKATVCYFCKKKVKTTGVVITQWFDFSIPTVEVKVDGAETTLELCQADLNNPELVKRVET